MNAVKAYVKTLQQVGKKEVQDDDGDEGREGEWRGRCDDAKERGERGEKGKKEGRGKEELTDKDEKWRDGKCGPK